VQITNINLSVSNLFGYHKTELLNRKINLLMPSLYSKFHDAHVEKFIQSSDT
jgi:PAS domain S-box-containing protein